MNISCYFLPDCFTNIWCKVSLVLKAIENIYIYVYKIIFIPYAF